MTYRLLLDANIELQVADRLHAAGHDVEHVARTDGLDAASADSTVAAYSARTGRIIITHDDDFLAFDRDDYEAVFLFEDATISAPECTAIIDRVAAVYPQCELQGVEKLGREWL
jgi:hypothetical protein